MSGRQGSSSKASTSGISAHKADITGITRRSEFVLSFYSSSEQRSAQKRMQIAKRRQAQALAKLTTISRDDSLLGTTHTIQIALNGRTLYPLTHAIILGEAGIYQNLLGNSMFRSAGKKFIPLGSSWIKQKFVRTQCLNMNMFNEAIFECVKDNHHEAMRAIANVLNNMLQYLPNTAEALSEISKYRYGTRHTIPSSLLQMVFTENDEPLLKTLVNGGVSCLTHADKSNVLHKIGKHPEHNDFITIFFDEIRRNEETEIALHLLNQKNKAGDTPWHTAAKNTNAEFFIAIQAEQERLNPEQKQAFKKSISKVNKAKDNALHIAVKLSDLNLVTAVVDLFQFYGADLNAGDKKGMTALRLAQPGGDIHDYLFYHGATLNKNQKTWSSFKNIQLAATKFIKQQVQKPTESTPPPEALPLKPHSHTKILRTVTPLPTSHNNSLPSSSTTQHTPTGRDHKQKYPAIETTNENGDVDKAYNLKS